MAGGGVGSLIERKTLAERRLNGVCTRRVGPFALRRQPASGRLDRARVKLLELFDVGDDTCNLRRESLALFRCDFKMRELR